MRILITAPGTAIGRRVLRELLAPEFSVRVLVGDPACLPHDIRGQAEIVRGSAADAATLSGALKGVEALLWYMRTEWFRETDRLEFAGSAARAIRHAGTTRVVSISDDSEALALENILNESGAAIRHLRCSGNDMTEITDAVLRWLVRRDREGIESITVPKGRSLKYSTTVDSGYRYDTEEISLA